MDVDKTLTRETGKVERGDRVRRSVAQAPDDLAGTAASPAAIAQSDATQGQGLLGGGLDLVQQGAAGALNLGAQAGDLVGDHVFEPAVQHGGDAFQQHILGPAMNRLGVSPSAQQSAQQFVDAGQGHAQAASDYAQDLGHAAVGPFSELASKYAGVALREVTDTGEAELPERADGGPKAGGAKGGKGKLKPSLSALNFVADTGADLYSSLDATAAETFGLDHGASADRQDGAQSLAGSVTGATNALGDHVSSTVSERHPDLGTGGDASAEPPGWLDTALGGAHTLVDGATRGLTHAAGYGLEGANWLKHRGIDATRGATNLTIDGLQSMGWGPTEETQSAISEQMVASQQRIQAGDDLTEAFVHNLADPLGDDVADATLKLGVGAVNTVGDLGQIGGNLLIDAGQAGAETVNTVELSRGRGVEPEQFDAEMQNMDAAQAQTNEQWDTWQHQLDNAMGNAVDRSDGLERFRAAGNQDPGDD